jgi:hypothetical protein
MRTAPKSRPLACLAQPHLPCQYGKKVEGSKEPSIQDSGRMHEIHEPKFKTFGTLGRASKINGLRFP